MNSNDCRHLGKDTQKELRFRATQAVLDNPNINKSEIAKMFGVSPQALSKWTKKVKNNTRRGIDSLNDDNRGQYKRFTKLSMKQLNATEQLIQKYTPEHFKLPYLLWSREAVQELIKLRYKVTISLSEVSENLKKWDMTPKKPVKQAKEQDPEEVKKWFDKDYPEIKRKAKKQKAEIYWADESRIQSERRKETSIENQQEKVKLQ